MKITTDSFSYNKSYVIELPNKSLLEIKAEIHSYRYSSVEGHYNKTLFAGIKCGSSGWEDALTIYAKDMFTTDQLKLMKTHLDNIQRGAYHHLISQLCDLESAVE